PRCPGSGSPLRRLRRSLARSPRGRQFLDLPGRWLVRLADVVGRLREGDGAAGPARLRARALPLAHLPEDPLVCGADRGGLAALLAERLNGRLGPARRAYEAVPCHL